MSGCHFNPIRSDHNFTAFPQDFTKNSSLGPALPALTGRTRLLKQCSNSRVRPVVGRTLSDQSESQLVGQICLSDPPAGASVGQCLSDHRSNTAVRAPLELPCSTG
ncbi:hypothetical protein PCANC_03493 [Puccinia coronata f. sp. avenae]|uniref:Uncharacterized protein n=1 Tax=Puccinia coronata f. sp. avenae TaxID=200324 RepID=A0A2N5W010_9BASI|nr:hypothetical protein PCANC_03493 [Puccinia coronata f. sp. avenae]